MTESLSEKIFSQFLDFLNRLPLCPFFEQSEEKTNITDVGLIKIKKDRDFLCITLLKVKLSLFIAKIQRSLIPQILMCSQAST